MHIEIILNFKSDAQAVLVGHVQVGDHFFAFDPRLQPSTALNLVSTLGIMELVNVSSLNA